MVPNPLMLKVDWTRLDLNFTMIFSPMPTAPLDMDIAYNYLTKNYNRELGLICESEEFNQAYWIYID